MKYFSRKKNVQLSFKRKKVFSLWVILSLIFNQSLPAGWAVVVTQNIKPVQKLTTVIPQTSYYGISAASSDISSSSYYYGDPEFSDPTAAFLDGANVLQVQEDENAQANFQPASPAPAPLPGPNPQDGGNNLTNIQPILDDEGIVIGYDEFHDGVLAKRTFINTTNEAPVRIEDYIAGILDRVQIWQWVDGGQGPLQSDTHYWTNGRRKNADTYNEFGDILLKHEEFDQLENPTHTEIFRNDYSQTWDQVLDYYAGTHTVHFINWYYEDGFAVKAAQEYNLSAQLIRAMTYARNGSMTRDTFTPATGARVYEAIDPSGRLVLRNLYQNDKIQRTESYRDGQLFSYSNYLDAPRVAVVEARDVFDNRDIVRGELVQNHAFASDFSEVTNFYDRNGNLIGRRGTLFQDGQEYWWLADGAGGWIPLSGAPALPDREKSIELAKAALVSRLFNANPDAIEVMSVRAATARDLLSAANAPEGFHANHMVTLRDENGLITDYIVGEVPDPENPAAPAQARVVLTNQSEAALRDINELKKQKDITEVYRRYMPEAINPYLDTLLGNYAALANATNTGKGFDESINAQRFSSAGDYSDLYSGVSSLATYINNLITSLQQSRTEAERQKRAAINTYNFIWDHIQEDMDAWEEDRAALATDLANLRSIAASLGMSTTLIDSVASTISAELDLAQQQFEGKYSDYLNIITQIWDEVLSAYASMINQLTPMQASLTSTRDALRAAINTYNAAILTATNQYWDAINGDAYSDTNGNERYDEGEPILYDANHNGHYDPAPVVAGELAWDRMDSEVLSLGKKKDSPYGHTGNTRAETEIVYNAHEALNRQTRAATVALVDAIRNAYPIVSSVQNQIPSIDDAVINARVMYYNAIQTADSFDWSLNFFSNPFIGTGATATLLQREADEIFRQAQINADPDLFEPVLNPADFQRIQTAHDNFTAAINTFRGDAGALQVDLSNILGNLQTALRLGVHGTDIRQLQMMERDVIGGITAVLHETVSSDLFTSVKIARMAARAEMAQTIYDADQTFYTAVSAFADAVVAAYGKPETFGGWTSGDGSPRSEKADKGSLMNYTTRTRWWGGFTFDYVNTEENPWLQYSYDNEGHLQSGRLNTDWEYMNSGVIDLRYPVKALFEEGGWFDSFSWYENAEHFQTANNIEDDAIAGIAWSAEYAFDAQREKNLKAAWDGFEPALRAHVNVIGQQRFDYRLQELSALDGSASMIIAVIEVEVPNPGPEDENNFRYELAPPFEPEIPGGSAHRDYLNKMKGVEAKAWKIEYKYRGGRAVPDPDTDNPDTDSYDPDPTALKFFGWDINQDSHVDEADTDIHGNAMGWADMVAIEILEIEILFRNLFGI